MRLSRSDFASIRAKTAQKRAKRAVRVAENAGIALAATGKAPSCRGTTPKARKPRPMSQKLQIKALKKRILGVGGLWSQAVRKRDGKCVMCGKVEGLQAHHWMWRRSHSLALSVDIANGATLDYGCHIGRAHREADADFILQLTAKMTEIVGDAKIAEMRETAKHPQPLSLAFWQEAEQRLKTFLQNRG